MKNSLLLLFIFLTTTLSAQIEKVPPLEEIADIDIKLMMPMRDGVRLSTDVYRPKTKEKVPVIFIRTPYNFNTYQNGEEYTRYKKQAYEAVKRGYALVVQNERGRYFSEGKWDILGTPLTDGYDAFTWLAEQDWCNGKIGTIGCSSTAEWQMAVAAQDHPAHAAMVPQGFGAGVGKVGDWYEQGNWYRGGAEQMLFYSWLYSVQNDPFRPRVPAGATQEDLQRVSRFYDLSLKAPKVDWKEAFQHLPLKDLLKSVQGTKGIYEDMIGRKPNDKEWFEGGLYHDEMPHEVPSFWFVSWYDVSVGPNLALFNHVRNTASKEVADNQYLVIAPTLHCRFTRATENTIVGERSVGDARLNYSEQIYDWWDLTSKGEDNDVRAKTPRVQYYTMGSNKWQAAESWPPEAAQMTTYYLHSNGRANSLFGDGTLKAALPKKDAPNDEFVYDPLNPVPSVGGNVCCTGGAIDGGARNQKQLETRADILVYTTPPLTEGVEVSGFIESTLYVGSDAKDTDFTMKLIDVAPDGTAYNLDETIFRARYREGFDKEVMMREGEVYKLELSPLNTSNFFKAGHQIRIEISSSNFPRFARNLNTGGDNTAQSAEEAVVARNKVFHSGKYPSQVRLPIVRK
ncbi:MAG: CocE/NonD family hydrolase [Saprospiraceae bacterium]